MVKRILHGPAGLFRWGNGNVSRRAFSLQIGLYLFQDGREVSNAGRARTGNSRLGRRLWEHRKDRYDSVRIVAGIEDILIEALEPRQNRNPGDDLIAFEYIQQEDPVLEERRVREAVTAATFH